MTFLNQLKGVYSGGETDALSFAPKDVILYDPWQLFLKPYSKPQATGQVGLQPPEMVLHSMWFMDMGLMYWSMCANPTARIKPSVNV